MLYPDGMYFADSDGFGMENNNEETVHAIINTDLKIVEPFRPINDISLYLKTSEVQQGRNRRLYLQGSSIISSQMKAVRFQCR